MATAPSRPPFNWPLWALWTLATTVSMALQFSVGAWGVFVGPIALGLTQWLLLRRYLSNAQGWFWATTLGGFVAIVLLSLGGFYLAGILRGASGTVVGLVVGALLGATQWLVLKRHLTHIGVWIGGSAIAFAFSAGWAFNLTLNQAIGGSPFVPEWGWSGIGAISGAISGVIKGGVLVWLLHQRDKAPDSAPNQ